MKKKLIIGIAVVAIIIVALVTYLGIGDIGQSALLRKEASKMGELDITKEDIDMEIKTKGDYAVVEQTMKEYMNTYANNCKELKKLMEDERLAKILTTENYGSDAPEFINSKQYITEAKTSFNEIINKLIDMTNEETMKSAILDKNLDENMIELYNQLMLGDGLTTELKETSEALQQTSNDVNNIFDVQEKVINLLITNKGKWSVSGEEIQFDTQKLVNEYNNLIGSL